MNITDVDDKIILRARQNHLFNEYLSKNKNNRSLLVKEIGNALEDSLASRNKKVETAQRELDECKQARDRDDFTEVLKQETIKRDNVKNDLGTFNKLLSQFSKNEKDDSIFDEIISIGQASLAEKLDKEMGSTVTDKSIYEKHARLFEKEYFEDMRALNIRDPDIITRVTEYVPQVVKYVSKIIENDYAYVRNGSVYFDVTNFRKTHDYPKLQPKQIDSKTLLQEAEGALSQSKDVQNERKSPRDFALWKASKEGEPMWDSPWGKGRPGWHIECSVMAGEILGDHMDIHTGGKDLKFPHHDNEMAQTCAFLSDPKVSKYPQQWVNYWFHSGHLDIKGQKMSKSLKNFKTIRQGLETHSGRSIRLMFIGQSWYKTMDFSDKAFAETRAREGKLNEFFYKVNALNRKYENEVVVSQTVQQSDKLDLKLFDEIGRREINVDKALRDNFDYPKALTELFKLMNSVNKYIDDKNDLKNKSDNETKTNDNNDNDSDEIKHYNVVKIQLINKAASFVNDMLRIFGVIPKDSSTFLGNDQIKNEEYLRPVLDIIRSFRERIIQSYRNKEDLKSYSLICDEFSPKITKLNKENADVDNMNISQDMIQRYNGLLKVLNEFFDEISKMDSDKLNKNSKFIVNLTDNLRDNILPKYGIKIDDQQLGDQFSFWKLHCDISELEKEAMWKEIESIEKRYSYLDKTVNDWEKKQLTPLEFLKTLTADDGSPMYTKFDQESGMPTHDANGKELGKKPKKKAAKVRWNMEQVT